MWRRRAAPLAAIVVAIVLVAASLGWALLADRLTTPACALATPPANAGPLPCTAP